MTFPSRLPLMLTLLAGTALATPAFAACDVVGSITFTDGCGQPGFGILGTASADSSLTISNETIDDPNDGSLVNSYISLSAMTGQSAIDLELTLNGVTVQSHNYLGVDLRSRLGNLDLVIDDKTTISAAHSGVYVLAADDNQSTPHDGGDITVSNRGTITAGPGGVMGGEGIWAVATAGSVRIDNYGTVDATAAGDAGIAEGRGRGLYADTGSLSISRTSSTVYNNGTVDASHDGIRVNARNGTGTAINDVDGVVTGHSRRGIVVWAQDYDAVIDNRGRAEALEGTGVIAWGAKGATVTNSGIVIGQDGNAEDVNDVTFDGALVWADGGGIAKLDNRAGGSISSKDGYGVWLMANSTTNTDKNGIVVDNAGVISGKTTAIYVGADGVREAYDDKTKLGDHEGIIGGTIAISNAGVITALDTTESTGLALITLAGIDLTDVTITNLEGGVIGAGFDIADFDTTTADGLRALVPAASSTAIGIAVETVQGTVDNRGTLVGSVQVIAPNDLYEGQNAPNKSGKIGIVNNGLWVTSGASGGANELAGISNFGTTIALDETTFIGDFSNFGVLRVASLDHEGPTLIQGTYGGGPNAELLFDWASGPSGLYVDGEVFGRTKVSATDASELDAIDWSDPGDTTIIGADAADWGADAFQMDQSAGLAHYTLDHKVVNTIHTWSLARDGASTSSMDSVADIALATRGLLDLSTASTLERASQLRGGDTGGSGSDAPAAAPLSDAAGPGVNAWFKTAGDLSTGAGFDMARGMAQAGIDGSNDSGAGLGAFVTQAIAGLDFNAPDTSAILNGTAAGLYASYGGDDGLFVNGTLAAQLIGVDLTLAGIDSQFGGLTYGAQIEAGYSHEQDGLRIEPSVVLKADRTSFDTVDAGALSAGFSGTDRLATEAHLRVAGLMSAETYLLTPYAELVAGHAFGGTDSVTVSAFDSTVDGNHGGFYGSVTAGLEATSLDGGAAGFIQGTVGTGAGRTNGGIKLGGEVRF